MSRILITTAHDHEGARTAALEGAAADLLLKFFDDCSKRRNQALEGSQNQRI